MEKEVVEICEWGRGGTLGYAWVITALGLMDEWGLNWLSMTAETSLCFYQLSAGPTHHPDPPAITQSLSLCSAIYS